MINYFSDFRYVDPFRRYSRSKSKVVRYHAEFRTVFCPPNFLGWAFRKLYPVYHSCLAARRLKKFREDTPNSTEVIEPNTLNFRPIFKFSRLNFLGGTPLPVLVCASKAWPICSACKNFRAQHPLRAEISYLKKCILVGRYSHLILCN